MKLLFSLLTLATASATLPFYGSNTKKMQKGPDLTADSKAGMKLMSNARRVEQDGEEDFTWLADFSIRFQGCHHISQWNEEADGEEDVRIQTKRLVRFRLCPASSCSLEDAGGCDSGYGDYIVDMNMYMESYFEAYQAYNEWRCEYLVQKECNCNNDNRRLDEEMCEYDCYVDHGMEDICAENNPYNDDEDEEEEFMLEEYGECANYEFQNNNNRKLDEVEFFLGPYCAEQGGAIYLGLFTDDTCTTFADDNGGKDTFATYSYGADLPYSEENVIQYDCIGCKQLEEIEDDDEDDGNDNNNGDDEEVEILELCEEMYAMAGKCESNLGGYVQYPNENACNYMEGIKIVRRDGIVVQQSSKANKGASIFIGIFVVAFVLLAAYVYFLKTKLDRASINLSE